MIARKTKDSGGGRSSGSSGSFSTKVKEKLGISRSSSASSGIHDCVRKAFIRYNLGPLGSVWVGGGLVDVLLTTLSGITQCACLSDSVFHADREEADRNRFSLIKKNAPVHSYKCNQ